MKSLIAAALLATSAASQASVITFDDLTNDDIVDNTLLVIVDGVEVTFTGSGLQIRDFSSFGVGNALSTHLDSGPIFITFAGQTVDYVAFSNPLNNRGGEVDSPTGTIYDQFDNVLGTHQTSDPLHYMYGPDIFKVRYLEGTPGEGFVMGDFQFGVGVVPEPQTYLLMGMGLLALGLRRRAK